MTLLFYNSELDLLFMLEKNFDGTTYCISEFLGRVSSEMTINLFLKHGYDLVGEL